jgi:hypothetical protein
MWLSWFLLLVVISPWFTGCGGPTPTSEEEIEEEIAEDRAYVESDEEG